MSQIGTFGSIIFETSDKKILNPSNITREVAGIWADHELLRKKTKKEFMKSDTRKVTLEITFLASLGVRPREMLDKINKYIENGKTFPLIIGGKPMSRYNMAIMSSSEMWDVVISDGKLLQATVNLNFEEAK